MVDGADVHQVRRRIVGARWPVDTHQRAIGHRLVPEGRENPPAVDEFLPLGRDVEGLRYDGVADGVGLRRRGCLAGLLRDRFLVDSQQRFARGAIEDVDPTRLGDFGEGLARLAVDVGIEQDDRVRRVVIPDIVVDLLEVPA
ncbi:MAG TPA: hypothetical protein VGC34_00925, partial [Steroidobacteraceae bacterium]